MIEPRIDEKKVIAEEFLVADQIRITVLDIDKNLYAEDKDWSADIVNGSIETFNQFTAHIRKTKSIQLVTTLLTARPAGIFLEGNSPLRCYIGNSQGEDRYGQNKGIKGLTIVGCELGAVLLTRDNDTSHEWHTEIDPKFQSYVDGPRKLIESILQQALVDTKKFKFEEGRLVGLSLQKINTPEDSVPLTDNEKMEIKLLVESKLRKEGHEYMLKEIDIDTSGTDVDIFPKPLAKNGKLVGLVNIMRRLQKTGLPDISLKDVIMADDSFDPVKKAFPAVARAGGRIVAPKNRKPALNDLMATYGGIIADYPYIRGVIEGIWEALKKD